MSRCPGCDYPLPEERERLGARCPNCHDPLYEPAGRFGRPVRVGEVACAVHEANEALGPCMRCGNPVCEVCRCAWRGQIVCAACAEKGLAAGEGLPSPARERARPAWLSLLFGVLAWGLGAAGVGLGWVVGSFTGPLALALLFLTMGLFALSLALAVCALGHGSAALVMPGPVGPAAVATVGIVVGGGFVALVMGLFALNVWPVG